MSKFLEEQAKHLYRLVVRQTERGESLDADLVDRAKAVIALYDQAMTRGHEGPGVIPFRKEP